MIVMWLELDGVIHVAGKCCRSMSSCPTCKGPRHMTGAYNGPMIACETCDAKDWKPGEDVKPGVPDEEEIVNKIALTQDMEVDPNGHKLTVTGWGGSPIGNQGHWALEVIASILDLGEGAESQKVVDAVRAVRRQVIALDQERERLIKEHYSIMERTEAPIPMRLICPACMELHIDVALADKPHHTHACQHCGMVWRPAKVNTVGVQFLPGYLDKIKFDGEGNPQ